MKLTLIPLTPEFPNSESCNMLVPSSRALYALGMSIKEIATAAFAVLILATPALGQSRKAALVFNTFREPVNTFSVTGGFAFNGWGLNRPSDPSPNSVSFAFGVPDDVDGSQPLTVDVHFMTYTQSEAGMS